MSDETTTVGPSVESGGAEKARRDFIGRFHTFVPPENLTRAATAQHELVFKHTAGYAIAIEKIDWKAEDAATRKKKKFYLGCARELAEAALEYAGGVRIGKRELIRGADEVVAKYEDICENRYIFCLDYDNMPR